MKTGLGAGDGLVVALSTTDVDCIGGGEIIGAAGADVGIAANLKNALAQQTPATLAKIWKTSVVKALETAEQLVEVGFFERRGSKDRPVFWVPFLYRDALDMIQGPAD
jgi:hypothetical protein